jgi:molybdenum-dependent DNA-binding transcriptional regulator ModE
MQESAYMRRLAATIGWRLPGRKGGWLDPRVVELVSLAAREGSLAAAAREAAMPYRTAWALVDEAERVPMGEDLRAYGEMIVETLAARHPELTVVALRALAAKLTFENR